MPDFEPRAGQVEMAAAVAGYSRRRRPACRSRHRHRQDARVSRSGDSQPRARARSRPARRTSRNRSSSRTFPALRDALGVPFTATYMKGRANYLCLHRLDRLNDGAGDRRGCTTSSCRSSASGRRAPRPAIAPSSRIFPRICRSGTKSSATADTCLGTECPRYDDCFVTRMRQRAAASDIVIVNHHLLCADAAVRQNAYGEVIPACSRAIVDEAHQLEDVATQYFGFSVSNYRVEELARDVERLAASQAAKAQGRDIAKALDRLREHARAFLHRARLRAPRRRRRAAKSGCAPRPTSLAQTQRAAAQPDRRARPGRGDAGAAAEGPATTRPRRRRRRPTTTDAAALARRAGELRDDLRFLLRGGDDGVRLLRRVPRPRHLPARVADRRVGDRPRAPVRPHADDGAHLGDADRRRHASTTSATGSASGPPSEVRLPSEFDFRAAGDSLPAAPHARPALGRLRRRRRPRGRRDPRSGPGGAPSSSSPATRRCARCRRWRRWRWTIRSSRRARAPRSQLLNQFRDDAARGAVRHVELLAGRGRRRRGAELRHRRQAAVRLARRSDHRRPHRRDPRARRRAVRRVSGAAGDPGAAAGPRPADPSPPDRGVLAVLDPRLRTKGYGRRFIASLPPAPDRARPRGGRSVSFRSCKILLRCGLDQSRSHAVSSLSFQEESMVRRLNGRPPWLLVVAVVRRAGVAAPAAAQSTGMIKGVVKDAKGQPVEGAKVTIDMAEGTEPPLRNEDEQEGRVHPDRPAGGPYRSPPRRTSWPRTPPTCASASAAPAEVNLVLGVGGAGGGRRKRRRRTPS